MKKFLSIALSLVLISTLSINAFAIEPDDITSPEKIKITFLSNVETEKIGAFVSENGIVMDSFSVTTNDENTSGYVINKQDNFDGLWSEFVEMQTALLSEGIENNKNTQVGKDMQESLNAILSNDFQMAIVCDNPSSLSRSAGLIGLDIVESIEPINSTTTIENESTTYAETRATNWVPTSGSASAWASQNVSDATYLEVHYKWDGSYALSYLTNDSDSTLEADLVFYNYDGTAIATDWYKGNYTYNTNQPRPYQDTKAFDNRDEPVFCIGCSDASSLKAHTDYYWIAYANKTGSTGCMAKLNMQRGHRLLDFLYEQTWNVFGDETKTVIPFSSWDTSKTGTATYYYL